MSERWPALMTKEQAAEYLGCKVTKFEELRKPGVGQGKPIPSVVLGPKMVRYKRDDLDTYIASLPYGHGQCNANKPISGAPAADAVGHRTRKKRSSKTPEESAA